jgi:hypothetical protein
MKISEFKDLERKINNINFNQSYKNINVIMTILSYFGNLASIFLAYFFMSKIIAGGIENPVAVFISSVIILSGIELLKRDIFDKFSVQYLKEKKLTKSVLPLAVVSLLLICSSFYLSINGAHDFSNKSDKIEMTKDTTLQVYTDSLNTLYNGKIKLKEDEINLIKSQISGKDKEQTDIEAMQPLTRQQRQRVADLKKEKELLRGDITKSESDITSLKTEKDTEIKKKEAELSSDSNEKKEDTNKNSFLFVIISTIVELAILAGVYFNQYYRFRSYREYRERIERDPNFQKWMLYEQILDIIYTEDTRMNEKLQSNKAIIEICKVNGIIILPKDITEFLKVVSGLGIVKVSGSAKYINKQRDLSFEILRKHYGIE